LLRLTTFNPIASLAKPPGKISDARVAIVE
jgi:hypothetical protein